MTLPFNTSKSLRGSKRYIPKERQQRMPFRILSGAGLLRSKMNLGSRLRTRRDSYFNTNKKHQSLKDLKQSYCHDSRILRPWNAKPLWN